MGGLGSGRHAEGGSAKDKKTYSHSSVKTAQYNKKFTSSGFRKGGTGVSKMAAKKTFNSSPALGSIRKK